MDEHMIKTITQSRDKSATLETQHLKTKMEENEELKLKLESSLSNQVAEKAAMMKLTEENAKLRKHHDDMKTRHDEMERNYNELTDEIEKLKKMDDNNRAQIRTLEQEVEELKRTQGGDIAMRDMQDKLIRLTNEQAKKDKRIHDLELQLFLENEMGEKTDIPQQSSVCVIM